jgi:DNA-binding transcriptional LysR family regulator
MEQDQYILGITRMDLRHLRYFVAVAEERHFTRAAERLGIKQPPLSLQIKQLEQELGTPLFRRLTRGVELTEPGTLLLDEARQILEQVERTKANVRNRARGETGDIRVGFAGATYFQPRVPGLVQTYRRRYPSVVLSPVQGNTLDLVEALENGSVDVAFVRAPLEDRQAITVHPLVEETMRIVLPSNHPQARKRFVSLASFAQETIIFSPRASSPGLYDSIIASCRRAGFNPMLRHDFFDRILGGGRVRDIDRATLLRTYPCRRHCLRSNKGRGAPRGYRSRCSQGQSFRSNSKFCRSGASADSGTSTNKMRSMPEVARYNTIELGEPVLRAGSKIEACDQVKQALIGAVRDHDRQRFLVKSLDIAADEVSQQPAQGPLLRLVPAQSFGFLLEDPEGPQAVVLLRKPRMQVVHISLFESWKKLRTYAVGQSFAP